MKKTKLTLLAIAFGIAVWIVWPHQVAQTKTVKAVTPVVLPVKTKVLSHHIVAEKPVIANETENALKEQGLSMANSFGVSAKTQPKL